MIVAALRLFGLAAPGWMSPLVKWAIDIAIVAAIVGGLFWLHSHAERKAYNAAFNAGWSKEHAAHEITLRSLDDALGIIAAKNAESDKRAQAFKDAKEADARTIADLDRRYSSTAARVAALTAIARVGGGEGPCKVPPAVASALEGL